jgi:hypothetical protein
MKRVSTLWTLVPWFVPDFLVRFVPPWIWENVERAVYGGMTRAEWFQNEVDQFHAAQAARSSSPDPERKS